MSTELERFIEIWEREAAKTEKLLEALPRDGYDFRPDPEGRSLGELAWHLVEAEGYGALGIERGEFARDVKPEGITRPRTVEELAPGFARVHADAVARVRKLKAEDLDRPIVFFNGQAMPVRDILMDFILLHNVHHRGQLSHDVPGSGRAADVAVRTDARADAAAEKSITDVCEQDSRNGRRDASSRGRVARGRAERGSRSRQGGASRTRRSRTRRVSSSISAAAGRATISTRWSGGRPRFSVLATSPSRTWPGARRFRRRRSGSRGCRSTVAASSGTWQSLLHRISSLGLSRVLDFEAVHLGEVRGRSVSLDGTVAMGCYDHDSKAMEVAIPPGRTPVEVELAAYRGRSQQLRAATAAAKQLEERMQPRRLVDALLVLADVWGRSAVGVHDLRYTAPALTLQGVVLGASAKAAVEGSLRDPRFELHAARLVAGRRLSGLHRVGAPDGGGRVHRRRAADEHVRRARRDALQRSAGTGDVGGEARLGPAHDPFAQRRREHALSRAERPQPCRRLHRRAGRHRPAERRFRQCDDG